MKNMWRCPQGCKTGKTCPHLEAQLPSLDAGRRGDTVYTNNMARFEKDIMVMEPSSTYEDAEAVKMALKLGAFGLKGREIKLIIHRIVYGETFEESAKAAGYSNKDVGMVTFKRVLEKLKKKGYK
jgi:hypothetical protein